MVNAVAPESPPSSQHFTSADFGFRVILVRVDHRIQGERIMYDQTLGGTLRNLAIGLVLTAAIVGAGFALAFS